VLINPYERWKRRRHLAGTHADVDRLPPDLAAAATVIDWGEAKWPEGYAERVINAFADQGIVLHVLEAEPDLSQRGYSRSNITLYEPDGDDDVERSRRRLLDGLPHLLPGQSPVICWFPSDFRPE
jgi:hypothetical protein